MTPETETSDEHRFTALVDDHRGALRKVAMTYASTPEDRDDLSQEILVQLWRSFASYDPERGFATWMFRVALNVAISHVRRVARHRRVVGAGDGLALDPPDPKSTATGPDHGGLLQRLMASLDELDRALLLLHLEQRSYREIADVLGLSESNVGTKLNRLRERLRQLARKETK